MSNTINQKSSQKTRSSRAFLTRVTSAFTFKTKIMMTKKAWSCSLFHWLISCSSKHLLKTSKQYKLILKSLTECTSSSTSSPTSIFNCSNTRFLRHRRSRKSTHFKTSDSMIIQTWTSSTSSFSTRTKETKRYLHSARDYTQGSQMHSQRKTQFSS